MENTFTNLKGILREVHDNQHPPEYEEPPEPLDGNDLYLWLKEVVDVKRLERGE